MSFDYARIKAENPIAEVVGRTIDLRKNGSEYVALCPFHDEKTPSFTVKPSEGFFHCFGCGAHGDVIDFMQKHRGVTRPMACELLGGAEEPVLQRHSGASTQREASRPAWKPAMPVSADAPEPPATHPSLGPPDHVAYVRDQDGRLLQLICRWNAGPARDRKQIRPLCFDGKAWQWKAPPAPRPLYGLPLNGLPVLLVEGELKRDRAAELLSDDYDVVSWPNGAEGVPHAAWTMLQGHNVVLWPDAGPVGADAAVAVGKALRGIATGFRIIQPPPATKDGWDVADAIAEGWKREILLGLISTAEPFRDPDLEPPEPDLGDPGAQPPPDHLEPANAPRRSRRNQAGEIAWGEPVDFFTDDSLGAPELEGRHIPDALWPFVQDVAARLGADPFGMALSTLVSCSAVIKDTWKIQPRRNDYTWKESARLWGVILADPSSNKSAQVSIATRPLEQLSEDAVRRYEEAKRIYKTALADHKAALKRGDESIEPKMPRIERYMVEGTTVEALQEVLRTDDESRQTAPAGKVLARFDELGELFANLDRYKSGGSGGGDRGAYLRAYNGGQYAVDRIGRGFFTVQNWSLSLLGGCQPSAIQRVARDTVDDGLLQRLLWCVPNRVTLGIDRAPDRAAARRYEALFPALLAMEPARDPEKQFVMPVVLHAEGHAIREEVEAVARALSAMPDTPARLKTSLGKWSGQFARLVLTYHMINVADARANSLIGPPANVVPVETVERAAALMIEVVLPHLMRAHAIMAATNQTGHAQWIAGLILAKQFNRIATRDVTRAYSALRSPEDARTFADVMNSLVAVGWLEPEESPNPAKPTHAWVVNPAVHTVFKARADKERTAREQAKELATADMDSLQRRRKARKEP